MCMGMDVQCMGVISIRTKLNILFVHIIDLNKVSRAHKKELIDPTIGNEDWVPNYNS